MNLLRLEAEKAEELRNAQLQEKKQELEEEIMLQLRSEREQNMLQMQLKSTDAAIYELDDQPG